MQTMTQVIFKCQHYSKMKAGSQSCSSSMTDVLAAATPNAKKKKKKSIPQEVTGRGSGKGTADATPARSRNPQPPVRLFPALN